MQLLAALAVRQWHSRAGWGPGVLATAGGAEKVAAVRTLGAHEVVDYRADDWMDAVRRLAPSGVNVVFDPVGGEVGVQSLRCLNFGARYLIVGFAGGELTALPANRLLLHNATAHGVLWGEVRKRDADLAKRLTRDVYDAHSQGELSLLPGQAFPFEQAPQALAALHERRSVGKLWLELRRASR